MQWNNRKTSFNADGKKVIAEDNTLVCTATTEAIAAYICQLHNDKQKQLPRKKTN